MRALFLHCVLLAVFASAFCQNSVPSKTATVNSSDKARWDLDRYVWSHTHYKTGKNDKPVIDFDAIENWQHLGSGLSISGDGKYFAYTIDKGRPSAKKLDSLIVQSTENGWRKAFYKVNPGFFSSNSRQYIFLDKDILTFLAVGKDQRSVVNGVSSFKAGGKTNEWLAYQLKGSEETVVLKDLRTGKEIRFSGEYTYSFDNSNSWLVLQGGKSKELLLYNLKAGKDFRFSTVASYLVDTKGTSLVIKNDKGDLLFSNLISGKTTELWKPVNAKQTIKDFKLDGTGAQVAFAVEDERKEAGIWYWKQGMDRAVMKVNNDTKGIDGLLVQPSVSFTDNGHYIQFSLRPKPDDRKPMEDAVQLDIWSYRDTVLQSAQPFLLKEAKPFAAIVDPDNNKLIQLENEYESLYKLQGDYAIIKKKGTKVYGDRFWEEGYNKDSIWVVSLKDGGRRVLPTMCYGVSGDLWFSPVSNHIVFADEQKGYHYFSFDLSTGHITKISAGVPDGKLAIADEFLRTKEPEDKFEPMFDIAAWVEGEEAVLVYDNYDIWKLYLRGGEPPVNITRHNGVLNKTVFTVIDDDRNNGNGPVIWKNETVMLKAFNVRNKYNGYYNVALNGGQPNELYMGPCFMQNPGGVDGFRGSGMSPLKAAKANFWVVLRQTTTDAPSYFLTGNFKKYRRLTNLQSQKEYNWLIAELHSFQQLDGTETQGILYKPENFDSRKRYPVIVSFYTQRTNRLYEYLEPDYIDQPTIFNNPSWLISHGYLVFLPDIHFTQGQWGPSTINTIDGAVRFLKSLPFVDTNHLGATGHSNSGRYGYYLLTHSKSFAAMSVGAGTTNLISVAFSVDERNGKSQLYWAEQTARGTGIGLLWNEKARWLDHASVLNADKAISPLLLFHNKKDGVGPFKAGQAAEMYIALRRLGKPVWWLQYDNGFHTLINLNDKRDFTIRFTQFFDHYLKNAPIPHWMTKGLPYRLKGIESGYEFK